MQQAEKIKMSRLVDVVVTQAINSQYPDETQAAIVRTLEFLLDFGFVDLSKIEFDVTAEDNFGLGD